MDDLYKILGLLTNITKEPIICTIPTTYFTNDFDNQTPTRSVQNFNAICVSESGVDAESEINADNCHSREGSDVSVLSDDEEEEEDASSEEGKTNPETIGGQNGKRVIHRVRYLREEYRCPSCEYVCTTEKAFLKHTLRQSCGKNNNNNRGTKFSCAICGKDLDNENSLNEHMLKHRQDRHFCCDMCKFKTLQLKKLIQHRRMHTGEKPHLCPYCHYRSARRDNLRSHSRRVHKRELTADTFAPRRLVITPRKRGQENVKTDEETEPKRAPPTATTKETAAD